MVKQIIFVKGVDMVEMVCMEKCRSSKAPLYAPTIEIWCPLPSKESVLAPASGPSGAIQK